MVTRDGSTKYPHTRDQGWSLEESLDVDAVSAVCPNCRILLVKANTGKQTDLGQAEHAAAALGATELSNSYEGSETKKDLSYDSAYFDHPGIPIVAGSGDSGFWGIRWLPGVVAQRDGRGRDIAGSRQQHCAWLDGKRVEWCGQRLQRLRATARLAGTQCDYRGSPLEPRDRRRSRRRGPQHGPGGLRHVRVLRRLVPDRRHVASDADHRVGLCPGGQRELGTTAYSYAHTFALNDVVSGTNNNNNNSCTSALCVAGPGWDGPTGLGTPNGTGAF
jgi:hypothetical protein